MTTEFKIARILAGVKQTELSAQLEIPVSTLSQIECGWRRPNKDQLNKLSKALRPQLDKIRSMMKDGSC